MSDQQEQDNTEEINDLDSGEFDFLDEDVDETTKSDNPDHKPQNTSSFESKIKTAAVLSTLFLLGFFMFNIMSKKSPKTKITTEDVATEVTKKEQPEQQPMITEKTKIEPEQPTNEMADLFTTTNIDQTNNLEKELKQQQAKTNSITKDNPINASNMELYFGDNVPNKFNKKSEQQGKSQEIVPQASKLQETVENMTQEMTENVNQLKQLENKINDLANVLTKVNQNVGDMDSKMIGLTETVDTITQDVSNVKRIITDEDLDIASGSNKPISEETKLTYKQPGYSIHAIIPGRAWLKSPSGQILTIAEGDTIGNYGTVSVIDAANNIVRTSSGVSFR